jgi:hypothetical protein
MLREACDLFHMRALQNKQPLPRHGAVHPDVVALAHQQQAPIAAQEVRPPRELPTSRKHSHLYLYLNYTKEAGDTPLNVCKNKKWRCRAFLDGK